MKYGCMSGVEYNGKIVFASIYTNALFELDTKDRSVRLICILENEKCEQVLYRRAFLYKNEAWFLPQRGEHILNINLDTYSLKYYDLIFSKKYEETPDYPYYYSFIDGRIVDGNKLVCVPSGIDSIIVINLDTHILSSIFNISCPTKDLLHTVYEVDGKLYVLSKGGCLDKCITIDTLEAENATSEFGGKHFSSSILYGDDIYLIPDTTVNANEAFLGRIDLKTKKAEYFFMDKPNPCYYGGIAYEQGIVLFPNNARSLIRFLHNENRFEEISYPNEIKERIKDRKITIRPIDSNGRKLASLIYDGYIIEFDQRGSIVDYFDIEKVSEKDSLLFFDMNKVAGNHIVKEYSDLLYEDDPFSIKDYLTMI